MPHALRFLLATDPNALTLVLGVVYRTISRHLIGKAGLTRATGATGAVTLVQRFGSAPNLNVHFHMVFPDGAYQTAGADAPVFRPADALDSVSRRVCPAQSLSGGGDADAARPGCGTLAAPACGDELGKTARRLKRVFVVEIEGCVRCGGQLKIIASIEEARRRSSLRRYCRTWSVLRRSSIRASCRSGRGGRRCSSACCELEDE